MNSSNNGTVNACRYAASGLSYVFLEKLEALEVRTIEITPEDDGWIINGRAVRPGRVLIPSGISDRTR